MQRVEAVASDERHAGNGEPEPRESFELGRRPHRCELCGVGRRLPATQLARTRLHAVDAEQPIEQGSGERHEHADGDPTERRLRSALVEQGVAGRHDSEQHCEGVEENACGHPEERS